MPTVTEQVATCLTAADPAHVMARRDALDYLCAGQLYLRWHVDDLAALTPADVKENPAGHWGVCPNVNAVVSVLAPVLAGWPGLAGRVDVVHGAGHAGAAALARAWLDGTLGTADHRFARDRAGLDALFAVFPRGRPWGGEVTPLIPGVTYLGGQLGPALAFAGGTVLDAPDRLAVPLVGDGECETGETAAAWLATRAVASPLARHGYLVPVVLLNGLRMGGPSLLSGLTADQLVAYFGGLGWTAHLAEGTDPARVVTALARACALSGPIGSGEQHLVVCLMPKGAGAPEHDGHGGAILGTTRVHKTPLPAPRSDAAEFEALRRWLAGYRPERLFRDGMPTEAVHWPRSPTRPATRRARTGDRRAAAVGRPASFTEAVSTVLRHHAGPDFRVFSPDELSSNRVDVRAASAGNPCVEILNEAMCHLWLQGYLESGRRGLFITYEAFATVTLSLIRQYAKTRALADHAGRDRPASLVYLVTSLGWTNNYSHQDPAIYGALLDTALDSTHLLLPADITRLAVCLDRSLSGRGGIHVVSASKHTTATYPLGPLAAELADGIAVWPDFSDAGEPDLTLCGAGDVATTALLAALDGLRARHPGIAVRYVCLHDLTVLDPTSAAGARLTEHRLAELFPGSGPVVFAVPGFASAVKAMLFDRPRLAARGSVLGYSDPAEVIPHDELLDRTGMSVDRLVTYLLLKVRTSRWEPHLPCTTASTSPNAPTGHASSSNG
jgi:xylulose-5-phosphate/fructose-6-phosphate phosphoketolase